MKQLCEQCGKEYEAVTETQIHQRFGETKEVEVETTEGKCDACREAVGEDVF